jgi:L-gulono-1,4-lactone dehydrogenase
MDETGRVDYNEAAELFLWIVEKPDDSEDKKQALALAFEKDPETVLKAVHAVAGKANLYPSHFDSIVRDVPTWRNCIGEQPCLPLKYCYPKSLSELVGVVHDADGQKVPVRAVGSGHSFSDITNAQGAMLVDPSKGLNQVFPVDASIVHDGSDPANMIRAQCGITVVALNQALDARNLGLINMGAYDGQTISGALSTGTHGSGAKYGPMADFLLSIVLVTESGKVYQIEPSPSNSPITDPARFPGHLSEAPDVAVELKQDDDWFRAAKVAMGCLGLIYSYTLRVQAAFSLSEVRTMTTWEEVKPLLKSPSWPPPILQTVDHFELLINPYAEDPSARSPIHKCVKVERTRLPLSPQRGYRLCSLWQWVEKIGVEHSDALVLLLNFIPWYSRTAINTALGFLPDEDPPYVDISHTVFTLGIENTVKAWALELHFDAAADCVGAIDGVLAVFRQFAHDKGWYIAGPLGIRFVKGSDAFVAPQAGRFTCTVELDMLYGIDHAQDLLGKVKEAVCKSSSARVHWGLDWGYTTPEDVRAWYPDLAKWQAVYREVNPSGMFDNGFTKRLRLRE